MQQVLATPVPDGTPVARLERLAGAIVVAVWDGRPGAGTAPVRPMLDGALAPRPYVVLAASCSSGATRQVALIPWPQAAAGGRFSAEIDGHAVAAAQRDPAAELPGFDGAALMAELDPAARRRLARGLLAHLAGIGGRMRDAAAGAAALVAALWPDRPALRPVAAASGRHGLLDGAQPAAIGDLVETFVISGRGVRSVRAALRTLPRAEKDAPRLRAILPDSDAAHDVIFVGSSGLAACRIERARHELPSLLAWAAQAKGRAARRASETLPLLGALAGAVPELAAALRELHSLAPQPSERGGLDSPALKARIETAIADGGGLLVAGWIDDPQHLVAGLDIEGDGASSRRAIEHLQLYPRRLRATADKDGGDADRLVAGFVGYLPQAPEAQHMLQHRFALRLHSDATIPLPAPTQPADPAAARAAALASLKPEAVTPEILERCLAPAVAALHRRCLEVPRAPEIVTLGTPPTAPAISVIIPLYRNLEFLKFQIASFAVDPDRARCEYLYVLDSPEQKLEVEHLLRGLWRLHGLPMRLLVNPTNLGYAAANNIAATEARGQVLALVNSDVLPIEAGWASALAARLAADSGLAAVGPKLLFEDDSLQHAGMYFAPDPSGRWLNHHFHKGLPRHFPAALVERSVPALTGACLMVRAEAYRAVGGFTEDYVIGDYEDSDLCLKLRRAGHELRYVPEVELYHLERRSIRQHAGYMKGVACLYNSWLHAGRWQAEMLRLCPPEATRAAQPDAPSGVTPDRAAVEVAA